MSRITRPIGVLAVVAAAVALAGCAGGPQSATTLDTEADVTITWWTGQDEGAHEILEGLEIGRAHV